MDVSQSGIHRVNPIGHSVCFFLSSLDFICEYAVRFFYISDHERYSSVIFISCIIFDFGIRVMLASWNEEFYPPFLLSEEIIGNWCHFHKYQVEFTSEIIWCRTFCLERLLLFNFFNIYRPVQLNCFLQWVLANCII